jgi:hypothetical protein
VLDQRCKYTYCESIILSAFTTSRCLLKIAIKIKKKVIQTKQNLQGFK